MATHLVLGNCWRQLPLEEKRIWEIKAKQEKANHKAQFPDYRFRPVHNKNKTKDKSSSSTTTTASATAANSSSSNTNQNGTTQEEEERCEHVAQLLLKGMKGDELTRAIRNWDLERGRVHESSANSRPHPPPPHVFSPTPMSSFNNPFGSGNFGYGMNSNSGLALPSSAYHRRSSSVPLPLHNGSSDFFLPSYAPYSASPVDLSAIALPSLPFISQTRSASPVNNISRQQRTVLGHRRASSAQPVFRRSSTLLNNMFSVNNYANADFSGFDWTGMNFNTQLVQDTCPLPDVELKFDGFSFDRVSNCAVEDPSLSSNPLSSSASSSSASNRSSPWLETPSHTRSHSQHRSSLSIAPHDLPLLDVSSSDMNWHGAPASLLSATSSSSSSAFPSPDLSSPSPNENQVVNGNAKQDLGITPTNAMFDLNLTGTGAGDYSGMMSMGVVDYTYGYNDMTYSDMGMGMVGYNMPVSGGSDMGMGVGVVEMDAMWNGHGGQPQQA